jgi:hypothetical protein
LPENTIIPDHFASADQSLQQLPLWTLDEKAAIIEIRN